MNDTDALELPWTLECADALALVAGGRVLVAGGATRALLRLLVQQLGSDGQVLVLEPHRRRAEALVREAGRGVQIAVREPGPDSQRGLFDGVLACPLQAGEDTAATLAALCVHALRPGGRLAVDLPGRPLSESLVRAWQRAARPGDPAPPEGPVPDTVHAAFAGVGLRGVEVTAVSSLVRADAESLADLALEHFAWPEERRQDLALTLVEEFHTTRVVEVPFVLTRVRGMR